MGQGEIKLGANGVSREGELLKVTTPNSPEPVLYSASGSPFTPVRGVLIVRALAHTDSI